MWLSLRCVHYDNDVRVVGHTARLHTCTLLWYIILPVQIDLFQEKGGYMSEHRRNYRPHGADITSHRLSQLAPHMQTIILQAQSRISPVQEAASNKVSPLRYVLYIGHFLTNIYHMQSRRRNVTLADLRTNRIQEFSYSIFFQDVDGYPHRIFVIPQLPLLQYLGINEKRQIVLPLTNVQMPIRGMLPNFTWLSYLDEKGWQQMKDVWDRILQSQHRQV